MEANCQMLCVLGSVQEASDAHVDPIATKRHALGFEQRALALAFGQRAVGAHDAVPREVGIVDRGQDLTGEPRRAGVEVGVRAHEAGRRGADASKDAVTAAIVHWRRAYAELDHETA